MKMEAAKSADFTQDPNYQEYKSECLKMLESLVPSSQCIIVAGREITVPELIKEVEAD
ncbi:MAG: hypothetical protein KDD56_06335 [Bdellovibrionales bacterium]|nr:hypothetical protein [Bdellovibrionales bacterium]